MAKKKKRINEFAIHAIHEAVWMVLNNSLDLWHKRSPTWRPEVGFHIQCILKAPLSNVDELPGPHGVTAIAIRIVSEEFRQLHDAWVSNYWEEALYQFNRIVGLVVGQVEAHDCNKVVSVPYYEARHFNKDLHALRTNAYMANRNIREALQYQAYTALGKPGSILEGQQLQLAIMETEYLVRS